SQVTDDQAELEADIVSRQNLLTGDDQRGSSRVLRVNRVMATPANVAACAEYCDELALVVEQPDVAFRHQKRVVKFLHQCGEDAANENSEDDYCQNCVVHMCVLLLGGKDASRRVHKSQIHDWGQGRTRPYRASPEQKTTVQRRENQMTLA